MTRLGILLLLAAGCGGITSNNDDSGPPPDAGDGGSRDAFSPGCPSSEPAPSSGCSVEGLQCEYGQGDRWACNDVVTCSGGSWSLSASNDVCGPNPSGCPTSAAAATGNCSDRGLICDYSTSSQTDYCTCGISGGPVMIDGGVFWACSISEQQQGCPAARPELGETCGQPGLVCSWNICGVPKGLAVQCSSTTGTWVEGPMEVCAGAN